MTDDEGARARYEALGVGAAVTAAVTLVSALAPERFVTVGVACVFFGATWALVWRRDDAEVVRTGLALGGLVLGEPLVGVRVAGALGRALGWAAIFALATFPPFLVGFALRHGRGFDFAWSVVPDVLASAPGQLVLVALPEEAFYRGYLQTRLDDAFPRRVRVLGAELGASLLVTSAIFALGHLATIRHPARLAVFFPSLAFGFLRARTRGIGAGVAYHAACNLFADALARGLG